MDRATELILTGKHKGTWKVERFCCTSGNCGDCFHLPLGHRVIKIQMDDICEELAYIVARNFAMYNATAVNKEVK